jgi:hypothetical protein
MQALLFAVTVIAGMIDPLSIVAYGIAAYTSKTWSGAAFGGLIAGIVIEGLSIAIFGKPSMYYGVARVLSCIAGALALRSIGKGIRAIKGNSENA